MRWPEARREGREHVSQRGHSQRFLGFFYGFWNAWAGPSLADLCKRKHFQKLPPVEAQLQLRPPRTEKLRLNDEELFAQAPGDGPPAFGVSDE